MAPKRPIEDDAPSKEVKKRRGGFKVGPDNLPDGQWRRKVIKIKKDLIHKAKVKKSYAKLKSREPPIDKPIPESDAESEASWEPQASSEEKEEKALPSQELHPDRQAMLSHPRSPTPPPSSQHNTSHHIPNPNTDHESYPKAQKNGRREVRNHRRPKVFEKEILIAEKAKEVARERREEWERNQAEKKRRIEERERFRRAMAKARTGGRNGQRKLGKESTVLLEKVKRMVGEGK